MKTTIISLKKFLVIIKENISKCDHTYLEILLLQQVTDSILEYKPHCRIYVSQLNKILRRLSRNYINVFRCFVEYVADFFLCSDGISKRQHPSRDLFLLTIVGVKILILRNVVAFKIQWKIVTLGAILVMYKSSLTEI